MKATTNQCAALLAAMAATMLLAGCGEDRAELQAWMNEVRSTAQPIRQKIEEPKRFEPFRYERSSDNDPFAQTRLAGLALELHEQPRRGTLQPDLRRPRELLESYPLDTIRMVGHLANGQNNFALLQVDDMVHQARVGQHAGQDFGVITRIDESEVRLRELVQDAAGDWVQRETTLRLQEGSK
ncbi:MAG TPA: pilus assembly protein PilP [Burkholderiaceae bacterium]|nr:pilus assembly protein PilP [Burkholderiaceae bacterium]